MSNFILYSVTKQKTKSVGFWQDNNGKVFRDNIEKVFCNGKTLYYTKKVLFSNGEKAVFYKDFENAIIENENGQKQILRHCITWKEKRLKASFVKALLVQHNGFTITREGNEFSIELWKE